MCEPPSTSQRGKTIVPNSTSVLAKPSSINVARMAANTSKIGIHKSQSNFIHDTFEKIHLRTPTFKIDCKSASYDKLKISSTQQHFREDWGGVTAIRYFQNDEKLAVGFNSGDLQICSPMTSVRSESRETILKGWEGNDSISCIRFHPKMPSMLFSSSTAGTVMRRDVEDHTNFNDFFITEAGNEVYSMDFTGNGVLVTVGRDATVRLYNVAEEKLIGEMGRSTPSINDMMSYRSDENVHEKRIYSVRCHSNEPNVVLTGGWDGVKVWDLRTQKSMRSIDGPFIFGDTLDISRGVILTASCTALGCLQLWDLGSGSLIDNVMPSNKKVHLYGEYPYAAQFFKGDPTGDLVLYGVGGLQLISIKESVVLCYFEDEKSVEAIDSSEKKFAFGGKSNSVVYGKMIFPESEVSYCTSSCVSRTISSVSIVSNESESKVNSLETYFCFTYKVIN